MITCDPGTYLTTQGGCENVNWFSGGVPTTHGCYGSPPFLG
jgi:hypothetical protein